MLIEIAIKSKDVYIWIMKIIENNYINISAIHYRNCRSVSEVVDMKVNIFRDWDRISNSFYIYKL